jgi:hypothetical protein
MAMAMTSSTLVGSFYLGVIGIRMVTTSSTLVSFSSPSAIGIHVETKLR